MTVMPSGTSFPADNRGSVQYPLTLRQMAQRTLAHDGPIVIAAHVDPDGDALGSSLALLRAVRKAGKEATVVMEPPRYLEFLVRPGEVRPAIDQLEEGTLLYVLDSGEPDRVWGVDLSQAAQVFNVDHHGTNSRFGDLAVVEPSKAACALLVMELIDALGVEWDTDIATPCLTGVITDTGNFRHGNTNREAFEAAGFLIDQGLDYAALTDRLQWRHPSYFPLLGHVMSTVRYDHEGRVVTAYVSDEMRADAGAEVDDSDDFVGLIRYAEGTLIAALLKQRGDEVKVSVRTRAGASAQRICIELGGGGHVAAAGASLQGPIEEARERFLEAAGRELERLAAS